MALSGRLVFSSTLTLTFLIGLAGVRLENLGVGKRNALAAVRLDGKDAHFERVAVGVFHQGRVAQFAHDVLVNPARLVRRQQLRLDLFAADVHGELVNVRARGHRKQICAFKPLRIGIVEFLVHGRDGDLVVYLHVDVVVGDFQRREDIGPGRWNWAWPRRARPRQDRHRTPVRFVNDDESISATLRGR
jgi:hypothetical protein